MVTSKSHKDGVLYCKKSKVSSFIYLGCNINDSWDHSREIRLRIGTARGICITNELLSLVS